MSNVTILAELRRTGTLVDIQNTRVFLLLLINETLGGDRRQEATFGFVCVSMHHTHYYVVKS